MGTGASCAAGSCGWGGDGGGRIMGLAIGVLGSWDGTDSNSWARPWSSPRTSPTDCAWGLAHEQLSVPLAGRYPLKLAYRSHTLLTILLLLLASRKRDRVRVDGPPLCIPLPLLLSVGAGSRELVEIEAAGSLRPGGARAKRGCDQERERRHRATPFRGVWGVLQRGNWGPRSGSISATHGAVMIVSARARTLTPK